VDVGLGESCTFTDFEMKQRSEEANNVEKSPILLKSCDKLSNETINCGDASQAALLDHRVNGLARNSSYCMFFKLNHPNCHGQFGCTFYTEAISCGLLEGAHRRNFRIQVLDFPNFFDGYVNYPSICIR